jgi:hypothetical protein
MGIISDEPVLSSEDPGDGAMGVGLSPVLSVHVVDHQGDSVDLVFGSNVSGVWEVIGSNSSVVNETVFCDNTSMMSGYNTRYWWCVNATDPGGSGNWTNETFYFTTISTPVFTWNVTLNFTGPNNTNDDLVFGEASDASDGQDGYDVPKPGTPPSPFVYAWFDAGLSEPICLCLV